MFSWNQPWKWKKKELSIAFYPDSHVFQSRASLLDLMCLVVCRVYKGVICKTNGWQKRSVKSKSSKFVCIKSSLQFMQDLYSFCRNSKICRNSSHRFLWNLAHQETSTQSIGSVKHFQRKCRQGQKFDLEPKLLWRHCHVIFIPIAQKIIS